MTTYRSSLEECQCTSIDQAFSLSELIGFCNSLALDLRLKFSESTQQAQVPIAITTIGLDPLLDQLQRNSQLPELGDGSQHIGEGSEDTIESVHNNAIPPLGFVQYSLPTWTIEKRNLEG